MQRIALFIEESCLRALVRQLDQISTPAPEVPEGHQIAREILGPDFHGIDAVERRFGPLTADERQARREVRLRDHRTGKLLTEDESLRAAEACAGTHVLVATKPFSLVELHVDHKVHFANDPDRPWFGEPDQGWSDTAIRDPWLLVRKGVVPSSTRKDIDRQSDHLAQEFPKERFLSPVEHCYAALLHLLETGERLCSGYVIRFPVQTAEGDWVSVCWVGGRLNVSYWDGGADGYVGSASARTS